MIDIELEDASYVSRCSFINWLELENKTIFITGATGSIGRQIVYALVARNRYFSSNIKIIVISRSIKKAKLIFEGLDGIIYYEGDILDGIRVKENIDYIIHCANVTSSSFYINNPVETIDIGYIGTRNVLSLAKQKKVNKFLFLSSKEIYGVYNDEFIKADEDDLGALNPLDIRNGYPISKKLSECLTISYANEYDLNVSIARLSSVFGGGINDGDNRVLLQFGRSILKDRKIYLHTKGESVETFCYISDAVTALLLILTKGENKIAYNVCNPVMTKSIFDLANDIKEYYGDIEIVLPDEDLTKKLGYSNKKRLDLSIEKLLGIGWKCNTDFKTGFDRLIYIIKESENTI